MGEQYVKHWKFANVLGSEAYVIPIQEQIGKIKVKEIVCATYNGRVRKLRYNECPKHSPHVIGMVTELEPTDPSIVLKIELLDDDMQKELKCNHNAHAFDIGP